MVKATAGPAQLVTALLALRLGPAKAAQAPGPMARGRAASSTPFPAIVAEVRSKGATAHLPDDRVARMPGSPLLPPPPTPPVPAPGSVLESRPAPTASPPAALEQLWPALVRRVAWDGDGLRGTVHLELGAGRLSGATVTLVCEDDRIRVELSAPPGVDLEGWRARIASRLEAAGLPVDAVD
jgi:hypothetical protein